MSRRLGFSCALLVLIFVTTACGLSDSSTATPEPETTAIDPVFREFYNYLGGRDLLGDAIAPSIQEGGLTSQFIETGKLVFDPNAAPARRFQLQSLGVQMGLSEQPVPPPANPQLHYENGHVIYPDFYPLYEQLGAQMVGKPLTEVRFNLIRQRYEQYFENLGLYRLQGSAEVRLLSYGIWACGDCTLPQGVTSASAESGKIDVKSSAAVDPAFRGFVEQQGAAFTGFALQNAGAAGDGQWEQILENVVLITGSQAGQGPVGLRPLSEALHIAPEAPRPYSGDANMYFYPVQGDLGYEIPTAFWDYIGQHGGTTVFGAPITHYGQLQGVIYHQCFRNLCLMYDQSANEQARVRPEPYGYAYKLLYGRPEPTAAPTATPALPSEQPGVVATVEVVPLKPTAPPENAPAPTPTFDLGLPPSNTGGEPVATQLPFLPLETPTAVNPAAQMREITMQVWGRYNVVSSQQAQEISVWITENDLPSPGVNTTLTIKLPDGSEQSFAMPPTGANGQSSLMLPLISGPDSTLVPYRACYQTSADTRMCIADFFMLWNNP